MLASTIQAPIFNSIATYACLGIIFMLVSASPSIKPVVWIGSAKVDLRAFPEEVKDWIGFAL
jgi:hypothetical protein